MTGDGHVCVCVCVKAGFSFTLLYSHESVRHKLQRGFLCMHVFTCVCVFLLCVRLCLCDFTDSQWETTLSSLAVSVLRGREDEEKRRQRRQQAKGFPLLYYLERADIPPICTLADTHIQYNLT